MKLADAPDFSVNLLENRDIYRFEALKAKIEPRKEYIDKDLWVIRDFLTEEELNFLTEQANQTDAWYPTMRSPYGGNIRNKFLGYVPQYGDDGVLLPPHPSNNPKHIPVPYLGEIQERLEVVLPKYFGGAGALQSFFEVPDEQIIAELGHNVDYSMDFHYERHEAVDNPALFGQAQITGAFSIYINDNYDGGILEFKNKDYVVKPEIGMLVNVPLYKEFEHRVTKVTNGNRHTLYGTCWSNVPGTHLSSREDC
jgi:hypothetical protein